MLLTMCRSRVVIEMPEMVSAVCNVDKSKYSITNTDTDSKNINAFLHQLFPAFNQSNYNNSIDKQA